MENVGKVKIIETQEESEKDDEITYTLFVDGKTVSWAKSILYSTLDDIHTTNQKKRNDYGRELLAFMEKNAKNHCSTSMRTNDFDLCNQEAINFSRICIIKLILF